jgi:serine/threonine protein kinase
MLRRVACLSLCSSGFTCSMSQRFALLLLLFFCFPKAIHSRLNHPNIVSLIGAGATSKGVRFVVLERLDGGTLTQMLGYDTRIRDRRRRFWRKKQFAYLDVLRTARSIASAMQYCHEQAIPGSMVLHRDLKPDNIGESCTRWYISSIQSFGLDLCLCVSVNPLVAHLFCHDVNNLV